MLNLNQLRVLAAVARHGSVTGAARELHYSQPSVSHHLARLEEATGATLLQRVGRGIRLTPEGELLAGRAREILGRVEGATAELAAQVGLRAGRVRLAANQSVLSTIVPAAAAALADAGLELSDIDVVKTHNPFAVNDLWFAQQTGFALERMNPYGCSLVYGHPQGPTGMRGIVELVEALRREGGGVGVFTGCAAGDTGAALVLRVD